MAPNADEAMVRWWQARARASASPGAARDLILMNSQIDVRAVLPAVRLPTLVLHRRGDHDSRLEEGRYIAAPSPRHASLSSREDHVPWIDSDQVVDEIEEFLTGVRHGPDPDRVLATMLFTDIVGSTERATEIGDHRWRELLERHHELVRRQLERFQGEEVDTAGDGFLATFDGPARAIRCGQAIRDQARELDLEIRAGVHTGEVERAGRDVRGIAVHIGARVAARAGAGEILASGTVRDLVAGSGIVFEERGSHSLKGVPGQWALYAVR
jgi:class 3 adenylate cyclase